MNDSVAQCTRSEIPRTTTRLWRALRARYIAFRLREAERDLASFEREAINRLLQMEVHRKRCQAWRVRLAELGRL